MEGYQTTTEAALRKEQKATHMIAELTAIVREQKGRLAELTRAKQENSQELKVRRWKERGRERESVCVCVCVCVCDSVTAGESQ